MGNFYAIGDVHGKYSQYLDLIKPLNATVQVGDMGFSYEHMDSLDPKTHKFFGGNHDNYDVIDKCPNCLGDYGMDHLNGVPFFFCRGAFSIDQEYRRNTKPVSWW